MNSNTIQLAVAPMEGIMDYTMRQLLSEIGAMDYLVSEFVRITQYPMPAHTFKKLVPENQHQGKTAAGHPVHTQLLGSDPQIMAQSAINATLAGATHIDVNFGCPAKRVNGHGGGSVLLQDTQKLSDIILAIRSALPDTITLSAKIRLGYEDESLLFANVEAIEKAGAQTLTIHGRTKKDGYSPPARWEKIGLIRQNSNMTIIANGDVNDIHSLMKCQEITQCRNFMIGRGALANPFVFQDIRQALNGNIPATHDHELLPLFIRYAELMQNHYDGVATLGRLKQWCRNLRDHFPIIEQNITSLRQSRHPDEFLQQLARL